MTEEQRRFKIIKKESYEAQISEESKKATYKTFLMGLCLSAAILGFLPALQDVEVTLRMWKTLVGLLNAGCTVYNLKGIIEAISRKTMLQGKVEDINTELEMAENNESKAMSR